MQRAAVGRAVVLGDMEMNYDVGCPLGTDLGIFFSKWAIGKPLDPWGLGGLAGFPVRPRALIRHGNHQPGSKPVVRVLHLHANSMQVRWIT